MDRKAVAHIWYISVFISLNMYAKDVRENGH